MTVEPEVVTLPGRDIVSTDFVGPFLRAAKELVERTCKLQEGQHVVDAHALISDRGCVGVGVSSINYV